MVVDVQLMMAHTPQIVDGREITSFGGCLTVVGSYLIAFSSKTTVACSQTVAFSGQLSTL